MSHPPHDSHADKRTILRGAGLAMAGFLVRPLARVPFLFIVGRIYGPAELGRYAFAVYLLEAFAAFCRLGLKDNLFRFLAEHPEDQQPILLEALGAAAGLSVVCAILVFFGAPLIGEALHTAPQWRMLGLMIPILPVFVVTDLLFAAARFHRAVSYEVLGRSLVEPITLTGGALVFGLAGIGAPGLLIAYMTAQVLTLGVAAFGVARRFNLSLPVAPFDLARIRMMVTRSAPTGFADCVSLGFNAVGAVLVGTILGDAALGVYAMAMNLETALSKVRQAFDMIVVPVVSRGLAERGPDYVVDQLRMIGRWIITAQLPLFAVSVLFGADILGLFSHGFRSGAALLALLALAAVIDGGINLAQVPLFLSRPKANLAIAVLALATNLGLGVLLTPRMGLAGIGAAIVGALAVSALARQVLVSRIFGRSLLSPNLWRPVAATLGAAAVSALLLRVLPDKPLDRGLAAAGLAFSYLGLLALLDPDLRRRGVAWARSRL